MKPLLFVLYDGINNSVFESQVIAPLKKRSKLKPQQPIILISFEKQRSTFKELHGFSTHLVKKWWHRQNVANLKKILSTFPAYELMARGPIAGLICLQALNKSRCTKLVIQARGLLAEEFSYTHLRKKRYFFLDLYLFYFFRYLCLKRIEKKVYGNRIFTKISKSGAHFTLLIEAVSPALKEYLIKEFKTPLQNISVAQDDIPAIIPAIQIKKWRTDIRKQLSIKNTQFVYCYNGSAKPWQCPKEIITFFKSKLEEQKDCLLLILTQDKKFFKMLLNKQQVPKSNYHLLSVCHQDIFQYLCASDVGLLFRDKHVINWISRPTKALEYRAANLSIIHNNTVSYLNE